MRVECVKSGNQRTLRKSIEFSGVGLHTNRNVTAQVEPSGAGTGIRILRLDTGTLIPANYKYVVDTMFATVLGNGSEETVSTVEHFLSAIYGMGVDNAIIKVDGPEMPILDGSALPIAEKIAEAGTEVLRDKRNVLTVTEGNHSINLDNSSISIEHSSSFFLSVTVEFPNTLIGVQNLSLTVTPELFIQEIAPARTFVLKEQIEGLWASGLALGGSLENAVVVDGYKVMNEEGLRFSDEFVRHKILDLIGDFSLLGVPFQGAVEALRPGHTINSTVIRELSKHTQGIIEDSELNNERVVTGATSI